MIEKLKAEMAEITKKIRWIERNDLFDKYEPQLYYYDQRLNQIRKEIQEA